MNGHVTQGATLAEALATGRGTERPFRCHVHEDSNASASVNVLKGVWVCYACGASGVIDGASLIPEAEQLIEILKSGRPARIYPEHWLDLFDADHPSAYWAERFGQDVAIANRCGTHPETGQPTYPVRDRDGRVLGVVRRNFVEEPKYKYPWNIATSRTVFGAIEPNPVVVLVEGAADVMAIQQAKPPAHWTVLGCYGSGVHMPQTLIVADLAPQVVVAAFDDDEAGQLAIQRAHYSLDQIAPVVSHRWGSVGQDMVDPGDIPLQFRVDSLMATLKASGNSQYA